jgi:hypothetical protein
MVLHLLISDMHYFISLHFQPKAEEDVEVKRDDLSRALMVSTAVLLKLSGL